MTDLVIFENPGEIDTRLISSFGVNVKETDNPIGYFGTGMKYALAILMSEGASVDIAIGEQVHKVSTIKQTIRGQEFIFITLDGETLSFTTELGKNWKFWTAYRELYTNCMDENGTIYTSESFFPERGTTKIVVQHADFTELHKNNGNYFLQSELLIDGSEVAIHEGMNTAIFFQKIRVFDLPLESISLFSYNLSYAELTEDRTLKSTFGAFRAIARIWAESCDEDLIEKAITARKFTLENQLDYSCIFNKPTEEFLNVARRMIRSNFTDLNPTVTELVKRFSTPTLPEVVELDHIQETMLKRALAFWNESGFDITSWQIRPVDKLGEGTLGLAKDGIIFVSLEAFESGVKQLAITLFEEFIHLEYKVFDTSRAMQEKLLHIITGLIEKSNGEPL